MLIIDLLSFSYVCFITIKLNIMKILKSVVLVALLVSSFSLTSCTDEAAQNLIEKENEKRGSKEAIDPKDVKPPTNG